MVFIVIASPSYLSLALQYYLVSKSSVYGLYQEKDELTLTTKASCEHLFFHDFSTLI